MAGRLVTATAGSGAYSIAEDLPLGGPYIVEHGYLDGSGLRHTTFSQPTLVGYRIICYGHSTAVGRGGFGGYNIGLVAEGRRAAGRYITTISTSRPVTWSTAWTPMSGPMTLSAFAFTNAAQQIASAPVIFEAYGVSGTGISLLMLGTSNWTAFVNALATRKGVIEGMIWDQGQGDTDTDLYIGKRQYRGLCQQLHEQHRRADQDTDGQGRPSHHHRAHGQIRLGDKPGRRQLCRGRRPPRSHAPSPICAHNRGWRVRPEHPHRRASQRILYGDAYHPSSQADGGNNRLNERGAWTAMKHILGLSVHSGRGPTPASATRSGAVINVQLTMNDANSAQRCDVQHQHGRHCRLPDATDQPVPGLGLLDLVELRDAARGVVLGDRRRRAQHRLHALGGPGRDGLCAQSLWVRL